LLAPLAAFEGRRTVTTHEIDHGPVKLSIERGMLRAVTAQQPVARVLLTGDDRAVHAAAILVAGTFPVGVPTASLAALGIALATGLVPPARRLGPPTLPDPDMPVAAALAHIIGHLTDVILHYAPIASQPDGEEEADRRRVEAVHQMRVAVRRALSAASIFRGALPPGTLDHVRIRFKTLARALAHTRDWDVFVGETAPMVAAALPVDERLARLFAAAERRRRDYRKALAAYLAGSEFRLLSIELALFVNMRPWLIQAAPKPPDDPTAEAISEPLSVRNFGPQVVRHRWKKMQAAGKHIEDLDVPALHALRLRTKRARYAAEMFVSLDQGKTTHRAIRRLAVLQQALGVLNDGAVAAHLLEELGGPGGRHGYAVGIVIGFTAARANRIRPQINRAFDKLRKPDL
jgi:CHAD domain-containing protein